MKEKLNILPMRKSNWLTKEHDQQQIHETIVPRCMSERMIMMDKYGGAYSIAIGCSLTETYSLVGVDSQGVWLITIDNNAMCYDTDQASDCTGHSSCSSAFQIASVIFGINSQEAGLFTMCGTFSGDLLNWGLTYVIQFSKLNCLFTGISGTRCWDFILRIYEGVKHMASISQLKVVGKLGPEARVRSRNKERRKIVVEMTNEPSHF